MSRAEEPDRDEVYFIRYGGRVTFSDFVVLTAAGLVGAAAMIPGLPRWLAWSTVGLGVLSMFGLFVALSIGFANERSWVAGGRVQLPMILVSFVSSEVLTFASTYFLMSLGSRGAFNERLGPAAALYFSAATWTTAGFGDIRATSSPARLLVVLELALAVLTVLVVLTTAVNKAFARRMSLSAKYF